MKPLTIPDAATVRGILDGTITEWWEPMKKQPIPEVVSYHFDPNAKPLDRWRGQLLDGSTTCGREYLYAVGGRLYLREAWFPVSPNTNCRPVNKQKYSLRLYEASGMAAYRGSIDEFQVKREYLEWPMTKPFRWRPARSMPLWASRCVVEVESVRVRRAMDVRYPELWPTVGQCPAYSDTCKCPQHRFEDRWNVLFSSYPYRQNPWAWVTKFRRVA